MKWVFEALVSTLLTVLNISPPHFLPPSSVEINENKNATYEKVALHDNKTGRIIGFLTSLH